MLLTISSCSSAVQSKIRHRLATKVDAYAVAGLHSIPIREIRPWLSPDLCLLNCLIIVNTCLHVQPAFRPRAQGRRQSSRRIHVHPRAHDARHITPFPSTQGTGCGYPVKETTAMVTCTPAQPLYTIQVFSFFYRLYQNANPSSWSSPASDALSSPYDPLHSGSKSRIQISPRLGNSCTFPPAPDPHLEWRIFLPFLNSPPPSRHCSGALLPTATRYCRGDSRFPCVGHRCGWPPPPPFLKWGAPLVRRQ